MLLKVLLQEFKEVSKLSKDDTGIELRPNENNIYAWRGFLQVHNVVQVHLLLFWAMMLCSCCRVQKTHLLRVVFLRSHSRCLSNIL